MPDLKAEKESKIEIGQATLDDTLDFTGNTQQSTKKNVKTKKSSQVRDQIDEFSIGSSSSDYKMSETQYVILTKE